MGECMCWVSHLEDPQSKILPYMNSRLLQILVLMLTSTNTGATFLLMLVLKLALVL